MQHKAVAFSLEQHALMLLSEPPGLINPGLWRPRQIGALDRPAWGIAKGRAVLSRDGVGRVPKQTFDLFQRPATDHTNGVRLGHAEPVQRFEKTCRHNHRSEE